MPRRRYPRVEDDDYDFPVYISVAERRRQAERETAKLHSASPVVIQGSRIAQTFWGKSWCENLERYSDYANRLPRGRTYVRHGCVVDLKIAPGRVNALVSGTVVYRVEIKVSPITKRLWKPIVHDVTGAIDSLVELLKGQFPATTMQRLCEPKTGMFPHPSEIQFHCSCPDSARMCKHIAAVLYGVGARLDERPDLLFTLRRVDQTDLITKAGDRITKPKTPKLLESTDLSALFGIEIAGPKRRRK